MTPLKTLIIKDETVNKRQNRPGELHSKLLKGLGLEGNGWVLAGYINGWFEPSVPIKQKIAELCRVSIQQLWPEGD